MSAVKDYENVLEILKAAWLSAKGDVSELYQFVISQLCLFPIRTHLWLHENENFSIFLVPNEIVRSTIPDGFVAGKTCGAWGVLKRCSTFGTYNSNGIREILICGQRMSVPHNKGKKLHILVIRESISGQQLKVVILLGDPSLPCVASSLTVDDETYYVDCAGDNLLTIPMLMNTNNSYNKREKSWLQVEISRVLMGLKELKEIHTRMMEKYPKLKENVEFKILKNRRMNTEGFANKINVGVTIRPNHNLLYNPNKRQRHQNDVLVTIMESDEDTEWSDDDELETDEIDPIPSTKANTVHLSLSSSLFEIYNYMKSWATKPLFLQDPLKVSQGLANVNKRELGIMLIDDVMTGNSQTNTLLFMQATQALSIVVEALTYGTQKSANKSVHAKNGNIDNLIIQKEDTLRNIELHKRKYGWVIPHFFTLLKNLGMSVDELSVTGSDELCIMQGFVGSTLGVAEGFPVIHRELAYLGDATLTYTVAKLCFEKRAKPGVFQDTRTMITANSNLATLHDKMLSGIDKHLKSVLPITSSNTRGDYTRATMLEALIGVVHNIYGLSGAISFCSHLISFDEKSKSVNNDNG
jgi:hypothetical protein